MSGERSPAAAGLPMPENIVKNPVDAIYYRGSITEVIEAMT
jgi:hypothetical protein